MQKPVRQVALYFYWKDRQKGESRMLSLDLIRREQYRLYLNDAHAFPSHEVISVGIYPKPVIDRLYRQVRPALTIPARWYCSSASSSNIPLSRPNQV